MHIELFVYSVNLFPPLSKREGLLLTLTIDHEALYAEASPLPGWSHETLDQVITECKKLFPQKKLTLTELEIALSHTLFPSLQFAIESLLFQVQKKITGSLPSRILQIQGICFRDELISEALIENFSTWKVKVRSLEEWASIAPRFETADCIRLDANESLKAADALYFERAREKLEYIEEPGEEFHLELERRSLDDLLYFALDESFRKSSIPKRANDPQCAAYIFKPMLYGKQSHYELIAMKGVELKKEVVLSSAIESPVGLYQIASLSERFPNKTPWGLGTYRYFPEDFCEPFPKLDCRGVVEFSPIKRVKHQYLQKVAR